MATTADFRNGLCDCMGIWIDDLSGIYRTCRISDYENETQKHFITNELGGTK